jgi:YfiH family protein
MGWQVHGTGVKEWDAPPDGELEKVDAHVTARADLALLVLVADCLPVALAGGDRVAMVHCGWRGLAGGIVANAIAHFDEPPAAAVGPGIGACCYEVGDEVRAQFDARFADGRMLDLRAVAEDLLRAAGVERVEHVDLCTSCRADLFFSHRRDAGLTGRQGGLVWRT